MSDIIRFDEARPMGPSSPDGLLVMFHAKGSNAEEIIRLGELYNRLGMRNRFAVVAPDAPYPDDSSMAFNKLPARLEAIGGENSLRQWLDKAPEQSYQARALFPQAEALLPSLHRYIDEKLEQYGLDDGKLVLCGFSQGAMMALLTGLTREREPAAVISHSGAILAPNELDVRVRSRPPVLVTHREGDGVIGDGYFEITRAVLVHKFDIPADRVTEYLEPLPAKPAASSDGRHAVGMEAMKIAYNYMAGLDAFKGSPAAGITR